MRNTGMELPGDADHRVHVSRPPDKANQRLGGNRIFRHAGSWCQTCGVKGETNTMERGNEKAFAYPSEFRNALGRKRLSRPIGVRLQRPGPRIESVPTSRLRRPVFI